MKPLLAGLLAALLAFPTPATAARTLDRPSPQDLVPELQERSALVGMRARVRDVILPGTKLEVRRQRDENEPIMLRILATRVHGSAFRYDLEFSGEVPGQFDLTDYLVRANGTSAEDLPEVSVTIHPARPDGLLEPRQLEPLQVDAAGGYRNWLIFAGVAWALGLLGILFLGRRRASQDLTPTEHRPITLADRLQPIVTAAQAGELDDGRKAELERLLLAHWRHRLGLDGQKISQALGTVRQHPEAGALLRQLEVWLHSPRQTADVDIGGLLEPYRQVRMEDLDADGEQDPAAQGRR